MKRYITLACVLFVLGLAFSANAALVWRLNFDIDPVVNLADYTLGVNDVATSTAIVSKTFPTYLGSGEWRDYGDMQNTPPSLPDIQTGNFPDIVTPPTAGFQGGNAFFTCTGNSGDGQQHIGYYIGMGPGFSTTGDFTAEIIFMVTKIGTVADPVVDCEYNLQNVMGTCKIAGTGPAWELRVWPNGGPIGGSGQLELCNSNSAGGSGEKNVSGPNLTANTWYHTAVVYTAATNTVEMFVDGVSSGTNNPQWGDTVQNDWWIGAWPSNGANRGMAGWIDAVCLSDAVLTPSTFNLPRDGYSTIQNWEMY